MGLLDKLLNKKDKAITIYAPVDGVCISLSEVNDPTFAEEILGKGVAFIPQNNLVAAPADGTISSIFPTNHAFTMETEDGVELLVHIGLDTVNLKGMYFDKIAAEGQAVKKGDPVIKVDFDKLKEQGYDTAIPVVVCNSDDFTTVEGITVGPVLSQEEVIRIIK